MVQKWDLLTKEAFKDLFTDDTTTDQKLEEESIPLNILDIDELKNVLPIQNSLNEETKELNLETSIVEEMKNQFQIEEDKIRQILEFLRKNEMLDCLHKKQTKPKLTWFGVQTVEPRIAQNLALHGRAFGDTDVKTRSLKTAQRPKPRGRLEGPAWFDDFN